METAREAFRRHKREAEERKQEEEVRAQDAEATRAQRIEEARTVTARAKADHSNVNEYVELAELEARAVELRSKLGK
ncbi:hypothetical protein [Corallococcus silvisoli]|uniref:hypothetical protein n=1 Tax=Corallococcus silvisoli TaxID=2697031 RepID=UPI001378A091|nr:hypothetical protein [Corallococcus silvisoli]NBD09640.1 hypothetical protein [Corallococcus silvisoli]